MREEKSTSTVSTVRYSNGGPHQIWSYLFDTIIILTTGNKRVWDGVMIEMMKVDEVDNSHDKRTSLSNHPLTEVGIDFSTPRWQCIVDALACLSRLAANGQMGSHRYCSTSTYGRGREASCFPGNTNTKAPFPRYLLLLQIWFLSFALLDLDDRSWKES